MLHVSMPPFLTALPIFLSTLRKVLDTLGLKRYCCRRMLMTHVDLIVKLLNYNTFEKVVNVEVSGPTGTPTATPSMLRYLIESMPLIRLMSRASWSRRRRRMRRRSSSGLASRA